MGVTQDVMDKFVEEKAKASSLVFLTVCTSITNVILSSNLNYVLMKVLMLLS